MLTMIEKLAEEQTGSKAQAEAFLAGFVKEASFSSFFGNEHVQKLGIGLAGGIAAVALAKGVNATSSALTNSRLRAKFEEALSMLKQTNKMVKSAKPEKVSSLAETIFRFAPNIASDANLLGPILANALLGEGLDPMTVKSLVDLEGRYNDNHKAQNFVSFPK